MPDKPNNLPAKPSEPDDTDLEPILKRIAKEHKIPLKRLRKLAPELQDCGYLKKSMFFGHEIAGTVLDTDLNHDGAERLLSAFEREGVGFITRQSNRLYNLLSSETPLYTIDELEGHLKAFIGYLYSNRNSFIETGYPRTDFVRAPWFYENLNAFYPIKHPLRYARVKGEQLVYVDDEGNHYLNHTWTKEPAKGDYIWEPISDPARGIAKTNAEETVILCEYRDAAHIREIPSYLANVLPSLRRRFFNLAIDSLLLTRRALLARSVRDLTDELSTVSNDYFYSEELRWLFATDSVYRSNGIHGFFPLLMLIAKLIFEIETGAMDTLSRKLLETIPNYRIVSYLDVLETSSRKEVDEILDIFYELQLKRLDVMENSLSTLIHSILKKSKSMLAQSLTPGQATPDEVVAKAREAARSVLHAPPDRLALNEGEKKQEVHYFKLFPDDRIVVWKGRNLQVTDKQYDIIECMATKHKEGIPCIHEDRIYENVSTHTYGRRFRDSFSSRPELIGEGCLIEKCGRASYRLNTEPK